MSKNKKINLRNDIITVAKVYRDELAGKCFMYIYGEKYIEILFKTSNFSHLTGVVTSLPGKEFYRKAKKGQLNEGQFYFNNKHPIDLAGKKIGKLDKLPNLTNEAVFIIEDMSTESKIYKIGVSNLDFTLGVMENRDITTNKIINNFLIPVTFRIRGEKDVDKNPNVYIVDFILMKDNPYNKYDKIYFGSADKISLLQQNILQLIDHKLIESTVSDQDIFIETIEQVSAVDQDDFNE